MKELLTSEFESTTATTIQGSPIGPAAYAVNAGDLITIASGNPFRKFADDTSYTVVPVPLADIHNAP